MVSVIENFRPITLTNMDDDHVKEDAEVVGNSGRVDQGEILSQQCGLTVLYPEFQSAHILHIINRF